MDHSVRFKPRYIPSISPLQTFRAISFLRKVSSDTYCGPALKRRSSFKNSSIPVCLLGEGQLTQMKTCPNKEFPEPLGWLLLTSVKPGKGYGEKEFRDCCAHSTTSCSNLEVTATYGHRGLAELLQKVARASSKQCTVHSEQLINSNHGSLTAYGKNTQADSKPAMSSVCAQQSAGTDLLPEVTPGALRLQSAEALPGLNSMWAHAAAREHMLQHLVVQDLNSQETRSYQSELSYLEKVGASFFASYRSLEDYSKAVPRNQNDHLLLEHSI